MNTVNYHLDEDALKNQMNGVLQNSRQRNEFKFFNKTLLASAILLTLNSAYAATACDYVTPPLTPQVSCAQNGTQLDITIHSDITNDTNNVAAYEFEESYSNFYEIDKNTITLSSDATLVSDTSGIKASTIGVTGLRTPEPVLIVSTSGRIYSGKTTDVDGADPEPPILNGNSGGIINDFFQTNIRETQQAGVYLSGASGGILSAGTVVQEAYSEIVNRSGSKDTAAIYSRALESLVTTSGVVRSSVGDAIRLEDNTGEYSYTSGGYTITDPQGTFGVNLRSGSVTEGGSEGAGIKTTGGASSKITIDGGATLGALSDVAINVSGYDYYAIVYVYDDQYVLIDTKVVTSPFAGAPTEITNAGTITGIMKLSSGKDTVINDTTGIWNIRQWADTNRDGIRDTVAPIATSDFGGGTTELINRGQVILAANADGTPNNAEFKNLNAFRNQGRLILANGVAGEQFTVDGDYVGNNGTIELDTVLGGDNSLTDKVIINGATSGQTYVVINNLGGAGADALQGIKIIEVAGDSSGEFIQKGRIVAGAYDYSVVRGVDTNASNWYLTNTGSHVDPVDPVWLRPEAGAYTANLVAANSMFVTRLHGRLGETQYVDALTGEHKVTSLWLRNEGGHNRSRDESSTLRTQANRYVVQLGGDVAQWSNNGLDRFHLGLMGGYGDSKSNTVSRVTGYDAKGAVDGYSVGTYATWYANDADKSGLYVDGWLTYGWFDNSVTGQGLASETYKSKGFTASIESGYTFKLGESVANNLAYFIQPKAQVTWMGVKADDHKEANGTHVSSEGDGNIQISLGGKAFMNGYSDQDKGKDRVFQPFVEANWIHNTKSFGTTLGNVSMNQAGAENIAELKVGMEGEINKQLNLWGNVAQQVGNNGYSDTGVALGVKYNF